MVKTNAKEKEAVKEAVKESVKDEKKDTGQAEKLKAPAPAGATAG